MGKERAEIAAEFPVRAFVEYFVNVRIPEAGDYWIEILLDQRLRLRYPLHARKHHEGT